MSQYSNSKGKRYPSESSHVRDANGVRIRQVTRHESIHHQTFFTARSYDSEERWLFFISHRTGLPQIFVEERSTGELIQLTDRDDINEWSMHPCCKTSYVYFTAGSGVWRVDPESLVEECVADFGNVLMRQDGMIGSAMGTVAVSYDGEWIAAHFTSDDGMNLAVINARTGKWEVILTRDQVGHKQFCPDDSNLIHYAGPLNDRVWMINRDGTGNRRVYARNAARKEWITHEVWLPGTKELAFVDWPNGIRCIDVVTGAERRVTSINAWHAAPSPDGSLMVADTNLPDRGLMMFDPRDGIGEARLLCSSEASNVGAHWAGPFPYENGPIKIHAPQHTHPHPSFSPGGGLVAFTSDRSGYSQIYEVDVSR